MPRTMLSFLKLQKKVASHTNTNIDTLLSIVMGVFGSVPTQHLRTVILKSVCSLLVVLPTIRDKVTRKKIKTKVKKK